MTGERESRRADNSTARNLTNNQSDSTANLIGSSVEQQLDVLLWQLFLGQVELHELTPALLAWHTLAFDQGRASRDDEIQELTQRIERLSHEADLWYFCANNPGKRPSDYRKQHTSDLWTEASR